MIHFYADDSMFFFFIDKPVYFVGFLNIFCS